MATTPGLAAGQSGPPIARRAMNFFRAMGRALLNGVPGASDELYEARLTACDGCEKRNGKWCIECGCDLLFKAALATEECPLGKWPLAAGAADRIDNADGKK